MNLEELHGVLTASVTFTKGEEIKRNYSAAQGVGEQQRHSDVIHLTTSLQLLDCY